MCKFFSLITKGDGEPKFFDENIRLELSINNPKDYKYDSHASIAEFFKLDEDKCNKYEYNPITKIFTIDQINTQPNDSKKVEKWCNSFDFNPILKSGFFDLDLRYSQITSLPLGLTVGGWLNLYKSQITSLPLGLTVGGWLDLSYSQITSLPEDLTVGGWLDLRNSQITSLPLGLTVGGEIYRD